MLQWRKENALDEIAQDIEAGMQPWVRSPPPQPHSLPNLQKLQTATKNQKTHQKSNPLLTRSPELRAAASEAIKPENPEDAAWRAELELLWGLKDKLKDVKRGVLKSFLDVDANNAKSWVGKPNLYASASAPTSSPGAYAP